MKRIINLMGLVCLVVQINAQVNGLPKNHKKMKLNAGVITEKLAESKKFYQEVLGFGVTFENEFYLLMHTPNHQAEIGFLLPDHPSQQPLFHTAYAGKGMYFTIEVENVDALYEAIQKKGIEIKIPIRDEPWGDRHFAIQDPNGIGIDMVTYTAPEDR